MQVKENTLSLLWLGRCPQETLSQNIGYIFLSGYVVKAAVN
jgi:hypothetical protein